MGSGKTAVGRALAEKLGCPWGDLDRMLEKSDLEKRSCSEIIESEGEDAFRNLEFRILEEWVLSAGKKRQLLSLGGGAIVHEGVRGILKSPDFWVIWLRADPTALAERVEKEGIPSRPLLGDPADRGDLVRRITRLLDDRNPLYSMAADQILDTETSTVEKIVQDLEVQFREVKG